jgi:hypothetical protein
MVCNKVAIGALAVAGKVDDSVASFKVTFFGAFSLLPSSIFFKTHSAETKLFSFPAFFSYQLDHNPIIN